ISNAGNSEPEYDAIISNAGNSEPEYDAIISNAGNSEPEYDAIISNAGGTEPSLRDEVAAAFDEQKRLSAGRTAEDEAISHGPGAALPDTGPDGVDAVDELLDGLDD
ncbi:MAG: hypothetical protein AAGA42_03605, partial [Actinomycetota bacterium]